MNQSSTPRTALWGALTAVICYGIAMGMLEAICVVYLRQLLLPPGTTQFDIQSLDRYPIEMWREVCTIVMLGSVAWLAGKNTATRFGFFVAAFGVWDIWYYIGLYLWAGWPTSLLEWDCLFLLPCPWYGPVLAPVLVSVAFVVSCVLLIIGEHSGRPVRVTFARVGLVLLGWAIWILSFTVPAIWEGTHAYPTFYPWWALALGAIPSLAAVWPRPSMPGKSPGAGDSQTS